MPRPPIRSDGGFALIALLALLMAGSLYFLVGQLDAAAIQRNRDEVTTLALAQAKETLIGLAVSTAGAGQRPGNLLSPDYFGSTESPPDYDGMADTGCQDTSKPNGLPMIATNNANMRCLGRLPWKSLGLIVDVPSQEDPLGIMPWYAVSANLVDTVCLGTLNMDTLNQSYPGSLTGCPAIGQLPYPWLTVRDKTGTVISDRVAFVVFIPGPPRGAQLRTPQPNLGSAANYLDTYTVTVSSAGCPSPPCTFNNAALNNDFIVGDTNDSANPDFNDRLIWVTIDELMEAVQRRAMGEAKKALLAYMSSHTYFPYPAALGSTNTDCDNSKNQGLLPQPMCYCSASESCNCGFNAAIAFKFFLSGSFTVASGSCSITATKECTCSGTGYCKNVSGSRYFSCDMAGNCKNLSSVTGQFSFTLASGTFQSVHSLLNCSGTSTSTVTCNPTAQGDWASTCNQNLVDQVPQWFSDNHWRNNIYYTVAPAKTQSPGIGFLTAGTPTNVEAIVIGAGKMITTSLKSQTTRPSSSIDDYLDSLENTNGDLIFDAATTATSPIYNDRILIVSP